MKDKKLFWKLEEIAEIDKWEGLYQEIEKNLGRIDKYYEELKPEMGKGKFREIMKFLEELGEKVSRLEYLPALMEATNYKDRKAKLMKARAGDLGVKISEAVVKIDLWIKAAGAKALASQGKVLDDLNAKRLFGAVPEIEDRLWYARKSAKFTLEEGEEKIISNKDLNGGRALGDLRTLMETEFEYDFLGKHLKSQAEILSYVHSAKAEERKEAYEVFLRTQRKNLDKFFLIFQAVVKDWDYEARLRGYQSPISVRNWGNRVPDEAVESLLEVCREKAVAFQKYFRLKAREMGVKKLSRYDLYASIKPPFDSPLEEGGQIQFEKAKKEILEIFEEFSPRFAEAGRKIFEDQHVDSHPSGVKESGAFCATVSPKISPYIMLNHTGNHRDVMTIAHELGHGIHSLYANKHWASVQQAPLPLAETASTLAEMLVFEKLVSQSADKNIKKSLLMERMDEAYATILRQNYFIEFEIKAHEAIKKGIDSEGLSDLYLSTLKEQLGTSVEIPKIFRYEWSYIPHMVNTPFYCYAYNFGELLSYALYEKYKEEGKSFVPKIEKILEAGGAEDPDKILKRVGVDMRDKGFWRKSWEVVEKWVGEIDLRS
jgi:oligoendopeptidase F